MTSQPIEANVVLTADTSGYDSSINQSAQTTDQMGKSVDSLTAKLDRLAHTASRKMYGVAVADLAGVTAATAAYSAFEHQMSSLNAQAAILNNTMSGQKRAMSEYANSVNQLRSTFGTSTRDAAELVQTISKMGDNTTTVDRLATTFTKLGEATQESSSTLAASMLQLQRSMGTPQRDTERYANQLAVLSANSNASASSILQFAQQLAPVGRMVSMSQTDVMGISTAFQKAGQDGFQAANVFSKMMSDVAYASQSGSPSLSKYANLVGMTVSQFKDLGGTDQFVKIFDAINRQGPAAITTLNRMGLDGMRTVRTITSMAQQSGGLDSAITQARTADPNAMSRGAAAATDNIVNSLATLRSQLAMTAEAFGKVWAGPAKGFVDGLTQVLKVVKELAGSPLGQLASSIAGLAAPVLAVGGAVLAMAKSMAVFASINTVIRGSLGNGFREGRQGFDPVKANQEDGNMGRQGRQIADNGSFLQRPVYNFGVRRGQNFQSARDSLQERFPDQFPNQPGPSLTQQWLFRNGMSPNGFIGSRLPESLRPAQATPSLPSQIAGVGLSGVGWGARNVIGSQYSPMYYGAAIAGGLLPGAMGKDGLHNVADRDRVFNRQNITDYKPIGALANWINGIGAREGQSQIQKLLGNQPVVSASETGDMSKVTDKLAAVADKMTETAQSTKEAITGGGESKDSGGFVAQSDVIKEAITESAKKRREEDQIIGEAAKKASEGLKGLPSASEGAKNALKGVAGMMGSLTSAGVGTVAEAARLGGGVLKNVAFDLFGGPVGLGLAGTTAAYGLYKAGKSSLGEFNTKDASGALNPYLQAGGLTQASSFTPTTEANQENATLGGAMYVSPADQLAGTSASYQLANPQLKGKSQAEALTLLAPQFKMMKGNAKSISALSLDLVKLYGQGPAQDMLNTLAQGSAFDPNAIVQMGLNQHSAGIISSIFAGGDENHGKVSDKFDELFGAYRDQGNYVAQTKGTEAGYKARADAFGQTAVLIARQAGAKFNPTEVERTQGGARGGTSVGIKTTTSDNFGTERTAYMKDAFKSLGIDLSDEEAASLRIDPNARTASSGRRGLITSVFNNGNNALQNKVLNNYGLSTKLEGQQGITAVINAMLGRGDQVSGPDADARVTAMDHHGVFSTAASKKAVAEPENTNAQITAVNSMVESLKSAGKSAADITEFMGKVKAIRQDDQDQQYILASAAQQQVQRYQNFILPTLSRPAQFQQQADMFKATYQGAIGDPHQKEIQQGAEDTFAQQGEAQRQYFLGLLYQQREYDVSRKRANEDFSLQRSRMEMEFNISRKRSEEDYNTQRKYQQEDFNLSRSREEFNFQLSRTRATADFNRQSLQAQEEFNISRKRQEQDYQHSIQMMIKQAALENQDIYTRTPVQRTVSGSWLAFNAGEQLKQMKAQEQNLNTLRDRGLSDNAIQQLKLTDPNNAQQLARLVGDVASDPSLVKKFNEAVSKRLKAAGAVTTDESSMQWQEFNRQYKLARERGAADFERQTRISRDNFERQMRQSEDDFRRSLSQQGADFETQGARQNAQFHLQITRAGADYARSTNQMVTDFNTSMERAAADLNRSAKTIDGNLTDILNQAVKKLSGHARTQATAVLQEFKNLKSSTDPLAVDMMKSLAAIFGVKYTAPKIHLTTGQQHARNEGPGAGVGHSKAEGGVLPGFTPGKDVHHFYSPTAGNLHLSGGEAIMRPEWTKAVGGEKAVAEMNAAAVRGQRFSAGGIFRPTATGSYGPEQDEGGFRAVDIGVTQGTPVHAASAGRVTISRDLVGPEPRNTKQNGYYSYGRYIQIAHDTGNTIYAHLVRRLAGLGSQVQGGELIGYSGHTGHTLGRTGDHLHFGANGSPSVYTYLNGSRSYAGRGIASGAVGGGGSLVGGGGGSGFTPLDSLLQDIYPKVEKAANMAAIHPLAMGQMSNIINTMATNAYNTMVEKYGAPTGGGSGAFSPGAPTNVTGNRKIVQNQAAKYGWGSGNEWNALYALLMGESGFKNTIPNGQGSSAYGIFQFLDSTWSTVGGHKTSDPNLQTRYGLKYIKEKYGDPINAKSLWNSRNPHWYGDGAIFNGGTQTIGVGERGPEMVLPLNDRGVGFLNALMSKMTAGNDAKGNHTSGYAQPASVTNQHNYQIDRSTTFSGPITVQANDPNSLINNLKARARTSALTNAAKGGIKIA